MTDVIYSLCSQLSIAAERIEGLTMELERIPEGEMDVIRGYYRDIRLAELENVQKLTLELTKQIVDHESRADDTAFMPGELDDDLGEVEDEGDDDG